MAGEANIWNPRVLIEVSANTKAVEEKLTAIAGQTLFTLKDFAYSLGTGALEVHKNGFLLAKGTDWAENTTTTFSLVVPAVAGDIIVASGKVGVTASVDVRDTDIFVANYQAIRDTVSTETSLYAQGAVTTADGGEGFYSKITGAAPGTHVDNNLDVIIPTGGDGSIAWLRNTATRTEGDKRYSPTFATVAAAKLAKPVAIDGIIVIPVAGMVVHTAGYFPGWAGVLEPQGSATYDVATLAQVQAVRGGGYTPDELGDHTLDNGLILVIRVGIERDVLQFGAKGDKIADDSPSIAAAIVAGGRDAIVIFQAKKQFLMKSGITVQKDDASLTLRGYGSFVFGHTDMAGDYLFHIVGDKATVGNSAKNIVEGFTCGLEGAKGFVHYEGCITSVVKDITGRENFPAPGSPVANTIMINFNDCFNVTVDTAKIEQLNGTSGIGVQVISTVKEFPTNITIKDSLIQNCWRNISITSFQGIDTLRIVNNGLGDSSTPNGVNGIFVTGFVKALELSGNHFENSPVAIELNGDIDADINNCHFSNNPVCYDFTGTGKANLDNNSYITDTGTDKIFDNNTYDIVQFDDPTITTYTQGIQTGFGTFRNLKRIYDIRTATFTVLNTDDNKVFANNGSIQLTTVNLPLTSEVGAGFRFGLFCKEAQQLRADPNPADQILFLTDAAGDRITSNNVAGTYVELLSSGDGFWQPVSVIGTWSDVN